jgi:hypothetical protein
MFQAPTKFVFIRWKERRLEVLGKMNQGKHTNWFPFLIYKIHHNRSALIVTTFMQKRSRMGNDTSDCNGPNMGGG